jgi:hypothetical protein
MDELFDAALDQLIASADGDMRRAMRALLVEAFRLQVALDRLAPRAQEAAPRSRKRVN